MADNVIRLKPTRPCPICGKPSAQAFHPFCSSRCQDVDLNRWLSGRYVIPAAKEADDDEGEDVASGPTEDDDES